MERKIKMFATTNDTDQFVLAIDGFWGFVSEQQAIECLDLEIEESPFGSMWLIDPFKTPVNRLNGSDMSEGRKISDYLPIDILNYFHKQIERRNNKPQKSISCVEEYKNMKDFNFFLKSEL